MPELTSAEVADLFRTILLPNGIEIPRPQRVVLSPDPVDPSVLTATGLGTDGADAASGSQPAPRG